MRGIQNRPENHGQEAGGGPPPPPSCRDCVAQAHRCSSGTESRAQKQDLMLVLSRFPIRAPGASGRERNTGWTSTRSYRTIHTGGRGSRSTKTCNCQSRSMNLSEDVGVRLRDLGSGDASFAVTSNARGTKGKNRRSDLVEM